MKHLIIAMCTLLPTLATGQITLGKITTSSGSTTQVRIEIPAGVRIDEHAQPGKFILDFYSVRLDPKAPRVYSVNDGVIAKIRVGEHPPAMLRVVLDLMTDGKCSTSRDNSGALAVQAPKGARIAPPPPTAPSLPLISGARPATSPAPNFTDPPPQPPTSTRQEATDRGGEIRLAPGLELDIIEDTAQDVPFVLQRYGGSVGFAPANNPVIEKVFRSPGWTPAPVPSGRDRLTSYFALQFADDKSATVEDLRKRYSIDRSLIAYALFPSDFLDVIHAEIRRAAAKQSRAGQVGKATIMFTMLGSGVEVKSVTLR
ncbi:MAG: AMIN domain-containing protein [Candidatus Solibacter sp.]